MLFYAEFLLSTPKLAEAKGEFVDGQIEAVQQALVKAECQTASGWLAGFPTGFPTSGSAAYCLTGSASCRPHLDVQQALLLPTASCCPTGSPWSTFRRGRRQRWTLPPKCRNLDPEGLLAVFFGFRTMQSTQSTLYCALRRIASK